MIDRRRRKQMNVRARKLAWPMKIESNNHMSIVNFQDCARPESCVPDSVTTLQRRKVDAHDVRDDWRWPEGGIWRNAPYPAKHSTENGHVNQPLPSF
jgi:hypothetical protein